MKLQFKQSFSKDLRNVKEKSLLARLKEVIEGMEHAQRLEEVPNLKKLKDGGRYYRIAVGNYRVGLVVEGGTVTFVRFLHRKEIYRYFP